MLNSYVLVSSFLFYTSGIVEANNMTQPTIYNEENIDLCIADLSCYLDTNQTVTLKFELSLDKEAKGWKFNITLEQVDVGRTLVDEEFSLCFDKGVDEARLTQGECEEDTVPARTAAPYPLSAAMDVPFFKDIALLTVSAPDLYDVRRFVSEHSDDPPITLCDEEGIC